MKSAIAILAVLALACAGCTNFAGKRSSTIKLNILGNTWESTTTLDGVYTESGVVR
jgi:hypothetical protein